MSDPELDRLLALAGVFQAAALVQSHAIGQNVDGSAEDTLFRAVMDTSPASVETVFGGRRNLRLGLGMLCFGFGAGGNAPELRLALAMVQLERHLKGRQDLLQRIGSAIERLRLDPVASAGERADARTAADTEAARQALAERLAAVYGETLSTLRFRIQIHGKPQALQRDHVAARIRANLLAGVRCAVLWQQVGGRRWRLVFGRGALRRRAAALLREIETETPDQVH